MVRLKALFRRFGAAVRAAGRMPGRFCRMLGLDGFGFVMVGGGLWGYDWRIALVSTGALLIVYSTAGALLRLRRG